MNRIILSDSDIKLSLNESILCDHNDSELIKKLTLVILHDTKLLIDIKGELKIDITIEIKDNVKCHIIENKKASKIKMLTKYILNENSYIKLEKYQAVEKTFERDQIQLKGRHSKIDYLLKTVCNHSEKYDITTNHYADNTESNIIAHGVCLTGNLEFNVTSYVQKKRKKCILNQNNRIINLSNNACTIRPILLIDDVDTIANHAAFIGDFKEDEYFYLQRLGIPHDMASKLLLEGFLKSYSDTTEIKKMFAKYWR